MSVRVRIRKRLLVYANDTVISHRRLREAFGVTTEELILTQWNRRLVDQTIGVLESSRAAIDDAISRLKDMEAVNPGGPTIAPAPDAKNCPPETR
jgi:hypothetical protein